MPSLFRLRSGSLVSWYLLLAVPALAHMEMSWPYPFRSKFNPDNDSNDIDYSMTSPLSPDGSDFPCKGYQNDDNVQTTATYTAGSNYNMTLAGSATHHGGSCQLSLSYDNAATFRVIKSMIGGCPLTSIYDFTIPSSAPSGHALLAWTWQNEEGNREFYMNCAAVKIIASSTRRRRRRAANDFESLPYIWKANLKGVNDCATVEGEDPIYPNPGSDVIYNGTASDSSTATSGDCDSVTPYGQTYRKAASGSSSAAIDGSNGNIATGSSTITEDSLTASEDESAASQNSNTESVTPASSDATPSQTQELSSTTSSRHAAAKFAVVSTRTLTTTTLTVDCSSTTTLVITITPTAAMVPVYTSMNTSAIVASPTPTGSLNSSSSHPPYATNANSYLPCVPGTFICTSSTTWEICTTNDGSISSAKSNVYLYTRDVAAGMECLPFYSTYSSSTQEYGQQPNVPIGSYRDDRIVRARPDGDCDVNGSLQCTNGGQQFSICDQGGWVQMGSVAAGTVCQDGKIIAAS